MILGSPGALPDRGVTDPQGAVTPELLPLGWKEADHGSSLGSSGEAPVDTQAHHILRQPVATEAPLEAGLPRTGDQAPGGERSAPPLPCAAHLPDSADSIEEAASRIVEAVLDQVKASGALLTGRGTSHMSLSSPPESGPVTERPVSASAGNVIAFVPGQTPQTGGVREEAPGNLAGCSAESGELEKMNLPADGPEPATGKQSRIQKSQLVEQIP